MAPDLRASIEAAAIGASSARRPPMSGEGGSGTPMIQWSVVKAGWNSIPSGARSTGHVMCAARIGRRPSDRPASAIETEVS